jgi:hypothetical protein
MRKIEFLPDDGMVATASSGVVSSPTARSTLASGGAKTSHVVRNVIARTVA